MPTSRRGKAGAKLTFNWRMDGFGQMEHSFNVEMAVKYGIPAAILYRHFQFWIGKNKADRRHFHDGRTWTYHTRKGLHELFPYLGEGQVRGGINKLLEAGMLRKGNYNRQGYDRTTWYAFEDEKTAFLGFPAHWLKSPMEGAKITNGLGENRQPIPDNNPDVKPDKKKASPKKLSKTDVKADSIQQLTREGIHPKVATALVRQQKHPPESINNAIRNAHSRRWWLSITDRFRAKVFSIPGYIVAALNIARREGHEVQLSQRSRAAEQLARDRKAGKQPSIGEKMTEKIRRQQLKKLGVEGA